jgi:fatty-acyl-CoA synthase
VTVHGSATASLIDELDDAAARRPDAVALDFPVAGVRWSLGEVLRRGARAAGQLAAAGVSGGARAGILVEDRRLFVDAFVGCHHLGAVPVPLGIAGRPGSPAWTHRLRGRVTAFDLDALVVDPPLVADPAGLGPDVVVVAVDGDRGAAVPGGPPSPAAFVQTTSGTTGDPKGVVVSQRAVLAHIDTLRETFAAGPQDRALGWLPFFHDMGLIGTLLAPLVIGLRSTLWSPAGFLARPSEWFAMVEHTRATIAPVPPVGLDLLAKVARRRPVRAGALTSLRALLVGSEAVLPATLAAFSRVATPAGLRPDAVLPVYGLAEAVLAVSARRPGDGPRLVDVAGAPHVTCGPAVPGTELRVEGGELLVRARARMSEYLDDPVATAAALDGEWLRTGDHAVLDGDEVVVLGDGRGRAA